MPVKIHGLPAHVLLIHVVLVLLPLAALMLVAGAVWPTVRLKLGVLTPATALIALIFVPITTHAGEWLKDRLPESKQLEKHADLGAGLLPWAIGIFVVALGVWLLGRRYELSLRPPRRAEELPQDAAGGGVATATRTQPVTGLKVLPIWASVLVAVLTIGVSAGGVVQLVRIGDSGAQSVWSGVANQPVQSGHAGQ